MDRSGCMTQGRDRSRGRGETSGVRKDRERRGQAVRRRCCLGSMYRRVSIGAAASPEHVERTWAAVRRSRGVRLGGGLEPPRPAVRVSISAAVSILVSLGCRQVIEIVKAVSLRPPRRGASIDCVGKEGCARAEDPRIAEAKIGRSALRTEEPDPASQ
jgi:hypothetical protein